MTVPSTLRLMCNNFSDMDTDRIEYSSQKSGYPISNCLSNLIRSKVWRPTGHFEVTDSNNKIYINDSIDKTVTLTNGHYATAALLATHVASMLNAASSLWTCAYSSTTFKFTTAHTGSVTMRFSQTTNAAWSLLGYLGSSDEAGTSFVSDAQRNHSHEYITFDFGYQQSIKFIALISPKDIIFPFSSGAVIKIQASNIADWVTPDFEQSLEVSTKGAFTFLDADTDTAYRFWRIFIQDPMAPDGPESFKIGQVYIGDYMTFPERPIAYGFSKGANDFSVPSESESGTRYFDKKIQSYGFQNVQIDIAERDDKDEVESLWERFGTHTPFFVSLDPEKTFTNTIAETTKFVFFDTKPNQVHSFRDFFTMQFSFSEAI